MKLIQIFAGLLNFSNFTVNLTPDTPFVSLKPASQVNKKIQKNERECPENAIEDEDFFMDPKGPWKNRLH